MLRDFDRETELRLMVGRWDSGSLDVEEHPIEAHGKLCCTVHVRNQAVLFTELPSSQCLPMRLCHSLIKILTGIFHSNMTAGKIIAYLPCRAAVAH